MPGVEVVSAHHERAVLAIDDVVLKIDSDPGHTDVEVEAMRLASGGGVPTPAVLWRAGRDPWMVGAAPARRRTVDGGARVRSCG